MHTYRNSQPSTKKKYRLMSFAAIDPNFFFMINNYASYEERAF